MKKGLIIAVVVILLIIVGVKSCKSCDEPGRVSEGGYASVGTKSESVSKPESKSESETTSALPKSYTYDGIKYGLYEEKITENDYKFEYALSPEIVVKEQDGYYLRYYCVAGTDAKGKEKTDFIVLDSIEDIPVTTIDGSIGKKGGELTLPDSIRCINAKICGTVNVPANLISTQAGFVSGVDNIEVENGVYYWGNWQTGISKSINGNTLTVRDGTVGILDLNTVDFKNINAIDIPESVKYVGSRCFKSMNNGAIEQSLILNGVEYVADEAFANARFSEVRFSDKLKYVGKAAFSNSFMENIDVSEAEGCYFGKSAFASTRISTFVFPEETTRIVDNMFASSKIASIQIPEGVIKIGGSAFEGCENLQSIELPDTLNEICSEAFYKTGIKSITIPGSVDKMGESIFKYCQSLTQVVIAEGVKSVEKDAFSSCYNLSSVSLPESLERIEKRAFCDVGSIDVTIPGNVNYIGEFAIYTNSYGKSVSVSFADVAGWMAGETKIFEEELLNNPTTMYKSYVSREWIKTD